MKLFGKEIGKKNAIRKEDAGMNFTHWIVYNHGEDIEFAECAECGHEVEPEITGGRHFYPVTCPHCHRTVRKVITTEEADAESKA